MKATLVIFFLTAQTFFALADEKNDLQTVEFGNRRVTDTSAIDFPVEEKLPESQRRRDSPFYPSRPIPISPGRNYGFGNRGRILAKLQNQVNRPFKQYGPPNQDTPTLSIEHVHNTPVNSILNQGAPSHIRQSSFAEENPIASQNNQPFGQNTANYLPPRNQKLPSVTPPYQFSSGDDFADNQQFQPQRFPEQSQQLQIQNQNFFNQNFDNQNLAQNNFANQNLAQNNFAQNNFQNQQISDAALFLTQNAQAISSLYGAPAPNQNYAPNVQDFEPIDQNLQGQQNQNFQFNDNQASRFQNQLPSYASGLLNNQETLEKIQSLEKDRIISHLQSELSDRDNSARFAQSENLASINSQQFGINDVSFGHHGSSFNPTPTVSTSGFQGYPPSSPPQPTPAPSPPPPPPTTTFQPGPSEAGSAQVGSSLPPSQGFQPTPVNPGFPQYGGFVPTLVAPTNFVPSLPTYGTTVYPAPTIKPVESAPTHFAIPIPSLQVPTPIQPPTIAVQPKPPSHPTHPGSPTFSIPLGPVHPPQSSPPVQISPPVQALPPVQATPVQPTIIKPRPVPVIPAATPIHPTYGVHPTLIYPGFVHKPVKVYPVYYYPHLIHRKPVGLSTHPWNYAPSYTQAKLWK